LLSGRIAIGVADHAGWAHLVAVRIDDDGLQVLDRRRVEIIDDDLPRMPYEHEAADLDDDDADDLIARVARSATANARRELAAFCSDLGGDVAAVGIRDEPGFPIPEHYGEARRSNRIVYAADGELLRRAFEDAADVLGLSVVTSPRGADVVAEAAAAVGLPTLLTRLEDEGKRLGSPWTKEHAQAAARAAIALTGS
jgi:hypothetical protein